MLKGGDRITPAAQPTKRGSGVSTGENNVRSCTLQGRSDSGAARRHQEIWLRHIGDVERTGAGGEPSAAAARSRTGAARNGAGPFRARQSAMAAGEAGH